MTFDIKCDNCDYKVKQSHHNKTYVEFNWECPKCGYSKRIKKGISVMNGNTPAEVKVYELNHFMKKVESDILRKQRELREYKIKLKFVEENPDRENYELNIWKEEEDDIYDHYTVMDKISWEEFNFKIKKT